ncbi:MAG: hypothetical protein ABWY78_20865 [Microvirga sp.]
MGATSNPARALWDRPAVLLAVTPLLILLAHAAAVLPHEFGHSFMAWALGIKPDPLAIHWGGTSLVNVLLLVHIDENVDYAAALHAGDDWRVALVAFAGPGLANGGLYLVSRWMVGNRIVRSPFTAWCLFWFLFMNLANLFDYVPIRTFSPWDDVAHFRWATGVSPWAVYITGGYAVLAAVIDFYARVLPASLNACGLDQPTQRAAVVLVATMLLFGYFAIPGFLVPDDVSHVIAGTSIMSIPLVLWAMLTPRVLRPAV